MFLLEYNNIKKELEEEFEALKKDLLEVSSYLTENKKKLSFNVLLKLV